MIDCIDLPLIPADLPFGKLSAIAGDAAFRFIDKAVELAKAGQIDAICTAPLNKEALNKAVSQYVHILNTSANSGWVVEENSVTNMTMKELETRGAQNGLVIEYKKGAKPPQKIQPNQVPTGVTHLIDRADKALKDVTVPEAMRGVQGPETSGIAIQAKQFASQQQLAVPLDNLAYTRQLLAAD